MNKMSLSFTGLERLEGGQQGIEGFFGNRPTPSTSVSPRKPDPPVKRQRTSSPIERITHPSEKTSSRGVVDTQKRPRLPTLHTGSNSGSKTKTDFFSNSNSHSIKKNGESSTRLPIVAPSEEDEVIEIIESDIPPTDSTGQWACPKCGFRTDQGVDPSQQKDQRQEHEDFHFAQDLQDAGSSPVRSKTVSGIGTTTTTKKKKKAEGIKAFFTPKPTVKKE
jgi:DNA polymerase eta